MKRPAKISLRQKLEIATATNGRLLDELNSMAEQVAQLRHKLLVEQAKPRMGCATCRYTGFVHSEMICDAVDMTTGEVTKLAVQVPEPCSDCWNKMDQYIEQYLKCSTRTT